MLRFFSVLILFSASSASALSARPEAWHRGSQPPSGRQFNCLDEAKHGSSAPLGLSPFGGSQPPPCLADFFVCLGWAHAVPGLPCGYNSPDLCACQSGDSGGKTPSRAHQPCAPAVLIAQALQQAHPVSPLQLKQKARYLCCLHYLQTLPRSFPSRAAPAEANRGWH